MKPTLQVNVLYLLGLDLFLFKEYFTCIENCSHCCLKVVLSKIVV